MHRTLSGWEYFVLLKEAQSLLHNRMSKAYETGMRQFRLDFGKFSLVIGIGRYFYITENPPQSAQTPTSLAMLLRKEISGKFLDSFKQHENDRAYILEFSNEYKLVLEQFSYGNMFLLDSNNKIIRPYTFRPTEKKTYNAGDEYKFQESPQINLLRNMDDWNKLRNENESKSAVSVLGRLSFGKIYSNNILEKLGINREISISEISDSQALKLITEISQMQKSPQFLILKKGEDMELSLCPLEGWEEHKSFDSFSKAVEHFVSLGIEKKPVEERSPSQIRLEVRLLEQKKALEKTETEISYLSSAAQFLRANLEKIDALILEAKKTGEKKIKLKIDV